MQPYQCMIATTPAQVRRGRDLIARLTPSACPVPSFDAPCTLVRSVLFIAYQSGGDQNEVVGALHVHQYANMLYLREVAVRREFRRRHIALSLIHTAMRWLYTEVPDAVIRVRGYVHEKHLNAQLLLKRSGLACLGTMNIKEGDIYRFGGRFGYRHLSDLDAKLRCDQPIDSSRRQRNAS